VVESFAGSWAVARPYNRGLRVVIGESTTAGEREIGVLLDIALVGVSGGLGGTFGLEMGIDS
jgi:hypothetical protein